MTTRLNVPALGIDQIISPRVSEEDTTHPQNLTDTTVPVHPDDPVNIPDVGEELIHLLADGHTELDCDGVFLAEDDSDEDLPLGIDPDTAMVASVFLHLLSEHDRLDALHLNEDEAMVLHESLHLAQAEEGGEDHEVGDLRWRNRRAMANAMRCAVMDHEAQQAVSSPASA